MSRFLIAVVLVAVTATPVWAARPAKDDIPKDAMYRFRTPEGVTVLTHVLPPEAIYTGYEIVSPKGRLIRKVEAALPEDERQKRREQLQEELEQKRLDEEIRRLYATPDDAIRARDRQTKTLNLSIEYARNTLNQLEEKLNNSLAQAAGFEQKGQEVPPAIQGQIESYTRQISEQQKEIENYEKDIESVQAEFAPIIKRLESARR